MGARVGLGVGLAGWLAAWPLRLVVVGWLPLRRVRRGSGRTGQWSLAIGGWMRGPKARADRCSSMWGMDEMCVLRLEADDRRAAFVIVVVG
ncbi:hypothetical protein BC567DRAFT_216330 [Phyllosticta citribraziliensis]